MKAETFAVQIAKDYKEISANKVMDLMCEEGLHPDDDYLDVEQALEGEGVKIFESKPKMSSKKERIKILHVEIEICGQCPHAVTIPGRPFINMRLHRICELTKMDVVRIGEIQKDCPLPNTPATSVLRQNVFEEKNKVTADIDKICWNRACLFFDQEHHDNCMPCNSTGADSNIYLDCDHVVPINPQDSSRYIKRREEVRDYLTDFERASTPPMKQQTQTNGRRINMQKFKLKTSEVDAIQVNTENVDEIRTFLGDHIYRTEMTPEKGLRIIIPNRHIEMTEGPEARYIAKHGDWIVKQNEGIFHVISAKAFPRIYELITVGGD